MVIWLGALGCGSVFGFGVFLEPAVKPEAYDSEQGFGEDTSAHF